MKLSHIDGYKAYLVENMVRCRKCGEYMIDDAYGLFPRNVAIEANIKVCVDETGVCTTCQRSGDYPVKCCICHHYKKWKSEFAYKALDYPDYPEGETEAYYICTDCANNQQAKVITILADADDVEKYGGALKWYQQA